MTPEEIIAKIRTILTTDNPRDFYRAFLNPRNFNFGAELEGLYESVCTKSAASKVVEEVARSYLTGEKVSPEVAKFMETLVKAIYNLYKALGEQNLMTILKDALDRFVANPTAQNLSILMDVLHNASPVRQLRNLAKVYVHQLVSIRRLFDLYEHLRDMLPDGLKVAAEQAMNNIRTQMRKRQQQVAELLPNFVNEVHKPQDFCKYVLEHNINLSELRLSGAKLLGAITSDSMHVLGELWQILVDALFDFDEFADVMLWSNKPSGPSVLSKFLPEDERKEFYKQTLVDKWDRTPASDDQLFTYWIQYAKEGNITRLFSEYTLWLVRRFGMELTKTAADTEKDLATRIIKSIEQLSEDYQLSNLLLELKTVLEEYVEKTSSLLMVI